MCRICTPQLTFYHLSQQIPQYPPLLLFSILSLCTQVAFHLQNQQMNGVFFFAVQYSITRKWTPSHFLLGDTFARSFCLSAFLCFSFSSKDWEVLGPAVSGSLTVTVMTWVMISRRLTSSSSTESRTILS